MSVLNRRIGLVQFADVGCAVWSTERRRAGGGEGDPIGGLVVAVTETADLDAGEIHRSFLVFDHEKTRPCLRWSTLTEAEVDRDSIEALDASALKRAIKRLGEDVAYIRPHQRRHGQPDPYEARCVTAMANLMEVLVGPDGRFDCQKALDPAAVAGMWRRLADDVLHVRGPITQAIARRAFAAQELTALIYGADGPLWGDIATPAPPATPAAPRPSYPPAPASMFVD